MQRWLLLSFAALAALLLCNVAPSAQATKDETPEAESYWKTYSLEGLPHGGPEHLEIPSVAPMFGLCGAVRDSAPPVIVYSENWSLGYGSRNSNLFDEPRSFASSLERVCGHNGDFEVQVQQGGRPELRIETDATGHEFVTALLKALRDWYAQRAEIAVYRLDHAIDAVVLTREQTVAATGSSTIVGRQIGDPGEVLVWRDATLRTFVTDYESYTIAEGAQPNMVQRAFPQGWEVSAGAWPLGTDEILVSGAFGSGALKGVRNLDAALSKLEAPDVTSQYSPACAVIGEGEGLVLGGEYLVVPAIRDRFRPVSASGAYINSAVATFKLTPLHAGAWPGSTDADLGIPTADADASRIEPYPIYVPDAAAGAAAAFVENTDLDENYLDDLGPLVVIQPVDEVGVATDELKRCREILETGPRCYLTDVSLYEIAVADLPAAPTLAELAAKGKRLASFHAAAAEWQAADWIDIEAESFLAGCYPITAAVATIDPDVRCVVSGTKIRVRATAAGAKARLEVFAAHAPVHEIKKRTTPFGDLEMYTESASAPAGALRLGVDLAIGESAFSVVPYPGDDSKRLVLFVKRVK